MEAFRVRDVGPIISVFVLIKRGMAFSDDPGFNVNINNYFAFEKILGKINR